MIRQASAWVPSRGPERTRLQDLERSDAIRWVDLDGGELRDSEALALLGPVCGGQLNSRIARDLISSGRFPANRLYETGRVSISAAFRTRHLPLEGGGVTSLFEPVNLLLGEEWLISCWLPPRVYRGSGGVPDDGEKAANELYRAVARSWTDGGGKTAADLAEAVRHELAVRSVDPSG